MTESIAFAEFIKEARNIVFFGGAGVSTESGIPDFRSKDGLYNRRDVKFEGYSPEYLLSRDCLYDDTKAFYEFYRQKMDVRGIEPNITHRFLAKLEKMGKLAAVVTQNIDGLHQKAGSKKVFELHGTTKKNYCEKCGKEFAPDYIFESKEEIPLCPVCKHLVRPFVTLYGEGLPEKAFLESYRAIGKANMLIIAGTSLTVQPAASLINEFSGEHLVVLNKEPLPVKLREGKDLMLTGPMGEVFSEVAKYLEIRC